MAHAPRKKSLEELKAEAIAKLERRGLNVRASTDQEITKAAFQKTKFKSNRNSPGRPIIETKRLNSTDRGIAQTAKPSARPHA